MAADKYVLTWVIFLMSSMLLCNAHLGGLSHIPVTGNIAIGRDLTASSTCGLVVPEEYCNTAPHPDRECSTCDNSNQSLAHPASSMTDRDAVGSAARTWWQSSNNVAPVTLDLDLGSTFFFTHVLLSFRSARPAAMVIEKSTDSGSSFQPVQFYSNDCERDFNLPDTTFPSQSSDATCTSSFSSAEPARNGEVLYMAAPPPLAMDLNNPSDVNRVTLTNLRIRLLRHNLPPNAEARLVNFAVYNLEVFGWCFCNGHTSQPCQLRDQERDIQVPSMCQCTNGTTGDNCEQCLPQNSASPWTPGFSQSVSPCRECECNDHSDQCEYDRDAMSGRCVDCSDGTAGTSCETCAPGFYRNSSDTTEACQECECNAHGTVRGTVCQPLNTPMISAGQCRCKRNVTGVQCDQCVPGTYNLRADNPDGCQSCSCPDCDGVTGRCPCSEGDPDCCPPDQYRVDSQCVDCGCNPLGSVANVCSTSGECTCKQGVSGSKCDSCSDGFFNLSSEGCAPCNCAEGRANDLCNSDGDCNCLPGVTGKKCDVCVRDMIGPSLDTQSLCTRCHCNGYSSVCRPATGWYLVTEQDQFDDAGELNGWSVERGTARIRETGSNNFVLEVTPQPEARTVAINFPSRYLGDKLTSYSLPMSLDVAAPFYVAQSVQVTAVLEIVGMFSPFRRATVESHVIDLSQELSTVEMFLTGLNFNERNIYFTREASSDVMHRVLSRIVSIKLIVTIPTQGGVGNSTIFIDSVQFPYAVNNRSHPMASSSEVNFVENCSCITGRMGSRCQQCSRGYTFDPQNGGQFARCVPCSCHNSPDICDPNTGVCLNCAIGNTGDQCQNCASGYYRQPVTNKCLPCTCPGLSESSNYFASGCSVGANDTTTCNCLPGHGGDDCGRCVTGYFGDPSLSRGQCEECGCSAIGSGAADCNRTTGQCQCHDMYSGRMCGDCSDGFWDPLKNGTCSACGCHPNGSLSSSCNQDTGVCRCRTGFTGDKCDRCSPTGTTGVFPFCEPCNECSSRFNRPISQLEAEIDQAEQDVNELMNRTETIDDSLLESLQQLLVEIERLLESRNITMITSDAVSTYNRLCDLIDRMRDLLNRLQTLQGNVTNSTSEVNSLIQQGTNLLDRFIQFGSLFQNVTEQVRALEEINFTAQLAMLESASNRSNRFYNLVRQNVTGLADQTNQTLTELNLKYPIFLNLRNMTLVLLETLREKILEYQMFIQEASITLCGSEGDCTGECGGVMCDSCGGMRCNGSISQVLRAANVTRQAQETSNQIYQELLTAINTLTTARNISETANTTSFMAEEEARQAMSTALELLTLVQTLLVDVQRELATPIPDVSQIETLQNETLTLQLTSTPEEVNSTVVELMRIISMFVDIGNVTEAELRERVDRALNTSRMADVLADAILRDVAVLRTRLVQLRENRTAIESQVVPTRMLIQRARNDTNIAESSLNSTERSLTQLSSSVANLSRVVTTLQEQFTRNQMRLAIIRNTTNQTNQLSDTLIQESIRQEARLNELEQTAENNLRVANRDLQSTREIHQRGEEIRKRASEQLLRVEVLLNRRQCIEEEQSQLRGNIHRVAAQLEAVRNDIRVRVSRNTVCLRGAGLT